MKQVWALAVALVFTLSGSARADDDDEAPAPARAKPFLTAEDHHIVTATGAFGPARDTMVVLAYRGLEGDGKFIGFALVPDEKAKNGQRKVELPRLPQGSETGLAKVLLVANLDKDADDELVVGFHVFRTVRGPRGNGNSYNTWEYAVLDWNGKKFVRLPALETRLLRKADARESGRGNVLGEEDARAALGIAKQ